MNENKTKIILILFCSFYCLIFNSCEPFITYNFVIKNESAETIVILLNYPETEYIPNGDNSKIIGCLCYNSIELNGSKITNKEHPSFEIELSPGENLTFIEFVPSSHNIKDFHSPWDYQSCILQIKKGERQLEPSVWYNMLNWQKLEDKSNSVKYILFIK